MFGSGSHLGRSGSAIYARDWADVVVRSSAVWRGIRTSPLIPLIVSECPGPIVRDVSEFVTWLESAYDSNPLGMSELWMELVASMEEYSMGTTTLETMDSYKCVFPSTLQSKTLDKVITFCSNNSRPVTFKGLPKGRCSELLGNLLKYLHENFRACSRPENFLVRADENKSGSENKSEIRILLVGASNLKHSLPHFEEAGLRCTFIGKPGWISSTANVAELISDVRKNAPDTDAFIFDLLGNSSVRFEQFDGTSSLPFFSNGKHHLGGKVVTTPPDIFKNLVENVIPIIKEKGSKPCVVLPPLPRYLFAGCCNDPGHCSNRRENNFQTDIMSGFIKLRNGLIKQLVDSGLNNFKVMDSCCATTCKGTAGLPERITALRNVTSKDGVHFVQEGYKNIAERCKSCLKQLVSGPQKMTPNRKPTSFFWRGFRSSRGSTMSARVTKPLQAGYGTASRSSLRGNPRGGHGSRYRSYHPYKRW
jgi:hypothetical protein